MAFAIAKRANVKPPAMSRYIVDVAMITKKDRKSSDG